MEIYTVRNLSGQLIGRYRALSAKGAIQAAKDEQMEMASTFRKSHSVQGLDDLTAKVEQEKKERPVSMTEARKILGARRTREMEALARRVRSWS